MNLFDRINGWIRSSESSLVNLLSALAPWAAPLAPAYMSFQHMTDTLNYPEYIAWSVAAVVEVLGLSSISTILHFWAHNKRFKKDERKAPTLLAVFSFASYLGIIMVVNVMIDAAAIPGAGLNKDWVVVLARMFLTLLSVPAAVILAIRTQHNELLKGMQEDRQRRREERDTGSIQRRVTEEPSIAARKRFLKEYKTGALGEITAKQIAERYRTSERNAFRWLKQAKQGDDYGHE